MKKQCHIGFNKPDYVYNKIEVKQPFEHKPPKYIMDLVKY